MNKLHLEYLRDTGNHATVDLWHEYFDDTELTEVQNEAVTYFLNKHVPGCLVLPTADYVKWLESKLFNL